MPTGPRHPCPAPHCGTLIPSGASYCARHARQRDVARGSAASRGYGRQWAAYSRAWLVRFPWCGQRQDGQLHAAESRCVARGLRTPATITDHIRAIRDGGAIFDPANHQSLCRSCNARKSV